MPKPVRSGFGLQELAGLLASSLAHLRQAWAVVTARQQGLQRSADRRDDAPAAVAATNAAEPPAHPAVTPLAHPVEGSAERELGTPSAHWLARARSAGPPAHWLEHIRQAKDAHREAGDSTPLEPMPAPSPTQMPSVTDDVTGTLPSDQPNLAEGNAAAQAGTPAIHTTATVSQASGSGWSSHESERSDMTADQESTQAPQHARVSRGMPVDESAHRSDPTRPATLTSFNAVAPERARPSARPFVLAGPASPGTQPKQSVRSAAIGGLSQSQSPPSPPPQPQTQSSSVQTPRGSGVSQDAAPIPTQHTVTQPVPVEQDGMPDPSSRLMSQSLPNRIARALPEPLPTPSRWPEVGATAPVTRMTMHATPDESLVKTRLGTEQDALRAAEPMHGRFTRQDGLDWPASLSVTPALTPTLSQREREVALTLAFSQREREVARTSTLSQREQASPFHGHWPELPALDYPGMNADEAWSDGLNDPGTQGPYYPTSAAQNLERRRMLDEEQRGTRWNE